MINESGITKKSLKVKLILGKPENQHQRTHRYPLPFFERTHNVIHRPFVFTVARFQDCQTFLFYFLHNNINHHVSETFEIMSKARQISESVCGYQCVKLHHRIK